MGRHPPQRYESLFGGCAPSQIRQPAQRSAAGDGAPSWHRHPDRDAGPAPPAVPGGSASCEPPRESSRSIAAASRRSCQRVCAVWCCSPVANRRLKLPSGTPLALLAGRLTATALFLAISGSLHLLLSRSIQDGQEVL